MAKKSFVDKVMDNLDTVAYGVAGGATSRLVSALQPAKKDENGNPTGEPLIPATALSVSKAALGLYLSSKKGATITAYGAGMAVDAGLELIYNQIEKFILSLKGDGGSGNAFAPDFNSTSNFNNAARRQPRTIRIINRA